MCVCPSSPHIKYVVVWVSWRKVSINKDSNLKDCPIEYQDEFYLRIFVLLRCKNTCSLISFNSWLEYSEGGIQTHKNTLLKK